MTSKEITRKRALVMNWNEAVWLYCERGTRTYLLAEPANDISSLFYLIAGLAGLWVYRRLPFARRSADHTLLLALIVATGAGSLAFHVFASQWSELAHLLPLLLFMVVFLAFALNRFLDVPPGWTLLLAGVFMFLCAIFLTMTCIFFDSALQPSWSGSGDGGEAMKTGATSCLNGAGGYVPVFLSLFLLGIFLRLRGHKAAPALFLASLLFAVSLVFMALDNLFCQQFAVSDHVVGSHFLFHVVSAFVLFLLVRATMVYQNSLPVQEIIPPSRRS